jgi:intergrase/recombinase
MGQIIRFACIIGLRPSEVVESVRLNMQNMGNNILHNYYNPERQALEHFRFPEIFLRQTKKAYISFVTQEMLELVPPQRDKIPSYNQIHLACWTKDIKCDMRFCRKVFDSHLRQEGIQPEVVDLLQGRTPQSVLARHYLVPQSTVKEQVLRALEKLVQKI